MATVAAVIASTHHPFYYRAAAATGQDRQPFADEWVAKIEAFRQTLTRARPDVLVMVGLDPGPQTSGGPSGPPSVTTPATGPPALLTRQAAQP